MYRYISSKPSFYSRKTWYCNKKHTGVFPLVHQKCYYFFTARYALEAGLGALGIVAGDAILLPSYTCGIEIDTVLNCDITPLFYNVKKDLLIDIDDLSKKITDKVKAVLVTHFIGFPQAVDEVKKICEEKNVFLIEDCAHAFLSTDNEKYLGSSGDISIFSIQKTLPIPDGGALVINNKNIELNYNPKKPNLFCIFFYVSLMLNRRTSVDSLALKEIGLRLFYNGIFRSMSSLRFLLVVFRKMFHQKGLYLVRPDSDIFIRGCSSWGVSKLSKNVINKIDYEKLKNVRKRNFEYLLNHFLKSERGILLFKALPHGVCPLFFPIIVESAEKRSLLHRALERKNIITHLWWDRFHSIVPWDEFPDTVYLKQRLLGFPVHQDLTLKHLDIIINEFEKAFQNL